MDNSSAARPAKAHWARSRVSAYAVFVVLLGTMFLGTFGFYFWHGHELLHPLVRTGAVLEAWRVGQPGAPWMHEAAFGYGWPFFIFYAPLGYMVAAVGALVFGSLAAGVKFSFIGSFLVGGTFMFLLAGDLARRGGSRRPAAWSLGGALLFTFCPFHLTDVFVRSALAECWGWAGLAALLWAVELLRRRPFGGFAAVALASAMLLCSHNIIAVWGAVGVGLYVLATAEGWRWILRAAGAGATGGGLAAWFWLPALKLLPLVRADVVDQFCGSSQWLRAHALDARQFFMEQYGAGFSRVGIDDTMSVNPGVMLMLALGLALAALLRGWIATSTRRPLAGLLLLCLALMFAMTHWMPWEIMPPLLRYLQFPWRLLALLAPLAIAAIALAASAIERWVHPLALALPEVALALCMLPMLLVRPYPVIEGDCQLAHWSRAMEIRVGHYAGCVALDFLPRTVDERYSDNLWLAANPPPEHRLEMKPGAQMAAPPERTATGYRYDLVLERPLLLTMHVYDFPGWTLRIDGHEEPGRLGHTLGGLLRLSLPAGASQVEVEYREPPVRQHAALLSLLTLAALVVGLSLARFRVFESCFRGSI
ncbi:hypothetical protein HQ520_10760 [bacterium]|nr:hypothetical protein [bacterium]